MGIQLHVSYYPTHQLDHGVQSVSRWKPDPDVLDERKVEIHRMLARRDVAARRCADTPRELPLARIVAVYSLITH